MPDQEAKLVILSQQERTRFKDAGGSEKVVTVLFKVGEDGPFSEDFTFPEFTVEKVQARLEDRARVVRATRALG